jgi:hypothetical protein
MNLLQPLANGSVHYCKAARIYARITRNLCGNNFSKTLVRVYTYTIGGDDFKVRFSVTMKP